MKKCSDCNVEMIENIKIRGQHPFEIGVDGRSDILLDVATGEKGNFIGITYDKVNTLYVKARMCPKCMKLEFYASSEIDE